MTDLPSVTISPKRPKAIAASYERVLQLTVEFGLVDQISAEGKLPRLALIRSPNPR